MSDPYKILEISSDATIEQIKNAYRKLAKKYHPDNYVDSPLKDVAEQKMQEINNAFDDIMNQRRSSGQESISREDAEEASSSQYQTATSGNTGYSYQSSFSDVRRMIQNNRIVEAEELLDGIPANRRDAEWHFLKGTIYYSRGWLDEAANHFSTAVNMNPNNPEYRSTLNRVQWQRQGNTGNQYQGPYRTNGNGRGNVGCSPCDICTGLLCADCCCECMGGDLIACC